MLYQGNIEFYLDRTPHTQVELFEVLASRSYLEYDGIRCFRTSNTHSATRIPIVVAVIILNQEGGGGGGGDENIAT